MSTTPRPTNQELFFTIAHWMSHKRLGEITFGLPFPKRYYIVEVDVGKFRYLEELPGRVVRYTTEDAVVSDLGEMLSALPAEFGAYKFDENKCRKAVRYWAMLEIARFRHKIAPVLALSTPGYTFHRLDFDPVFMPTPIFDAFMSRVITNPEAFKAFIGALFDPTFSRQFYLWMVGQGGDGKGTVLRFIKRLFASAYTALPSDFKQQNQFFTAALVGKRVGAFQDCHNPRIVQSEIFMQLTGGDAMRIEEKGQPAYMADLDTMIIVSSNFEPELTSSEAHRRRAIICKMGDRESNDGDPATYGERFWDERAGIIWKCMEAWRLMKAQHGDMKPCQDITRDIAASTEVKWERIAAKYFVINTEIVGTLKPTEFHGILAERERMNDFEINHFKRYLERLGVKPGYKARADAQRVMRGLHLRANIQGVDDGGATTAPQF